MIIKNMNLSDQLYEDIKDRVLRDDLKLGAKISVDEIAKYYDVSHTPVREALNKLSMDGIVISAPNKVHKIFNFSKKELLEVMEIRKICECYSIDKAIENIKQEKFEIILKQVLELKNLRGKDVSHNFYNTDLELHKTIIEGSKNSKLIEFYNQVYFIIETVIYRIDSQEKDINEFILEHINILSSIIKKDSNLTKKLLEKHLEHSTRYYIDNFM
ncbi:MAG: GntR family transcriptional regulator [Atribacterota bacterium]|nr:GntR family transcriptional regulator [Atribacterota bacterium]MDD5638184.1 GntR family transcriptional regulator [Atribacterota bacterium]